MARFPFQRRAYHNLPLTEVVQLFSTKKQKTEVKGSRGSSHLPLLYKDEIPNINCPRSDLKLFHPQLLQWKLFKTLLPPIVKNFPLVSSPTTLKSTLCPFLHGQQDYSVFQTALLPFSSRAS